MMIGVAVFASKKIVPASCSMFRFYNGHEQSVHFELSVCVLL